MSLLYIVATPIGNLKDISLRALQVLKEADLILAEDTRVAKKLLSHYEIKTQVLSYHHHSDLKKVDQILSFLKEGKSLALISDAGTPGISDPGNKLIAEILEKSLKVRIIPIPGPSAVLSAASIAGFNMDKFLFLGFPPAKRKRQKFFKEAVASSYPVVFFESPHKILKSLAELEAAKNNLEVVVCRELTKKFETIYRGKAKEVAGQIKKDMVKGEFVVIIKL